MKLIRATLNGGAGIVVHALDMDQKTYPGDRKPKALCGRKPGGGTTRMGAGRSRWRQAGICSSDSPTINCEKCLSKLAELGIDPSQVDII